MGFLRILWWWFFIWIIMTILQIMNLSGQLNIKEFNLFDETVTSPMNMVPINNTLKQFLIIPEKIHTYIVSFEPTKSSLYVGIEWLTGASDKSFITFLLYLTTFLYYFLLASFLAKLSTIFSTEKDQKIFFSFSIILYLIVIKVLWSL